MMDRLFLSAAVVALAACAATTGTADPEVTEAPPSAATYTEAPAPEAGTTRYLCDGFGDMSAWLDVDADGLGARLGMLMVGDYAEPGEEIDYVTYSQVGTKAYLEGSDLSHLHVFNNGTAEIESSPFDANNFVYLCETAATKPRLLVDPASHTNETITLDGQTWTQWQATGTVQSWGSHIRSRPDGTSESFGTISEGAPVEMVAETSEEWNGFPWFLVRAADGTEGYVAGGLLCSREGFYPETLFNQNNCD